LVGFLDTLGLCRGLEGSIQCLLEATTPIGRRLYTNQLTDQYTNKHHSVAPAPRGLGRGRLLRAARHAHGVRRHLVSGWVSEGTPLQSVSSQRQGGERGQLHCLPCALCVFPFCLCVTCLSPSHAVPTPFGYRFSLAAFGAFASRRLLSRRPR